VMSPPLSLSVSQVTVPSAAMARIDEPAVQLVFRTFLTGLW
jgi:hypothetical protein